MDQREREREGERERAFLFNPIKLRQKVNNQSWWRINPQSDSFPVKQLFIGPHSSSSSF